MNKGNYILFRDRKVIDKTFLWYNGTLCDTSRSIDIVGVHLEDAMPVLFGRYIKVPNTFTKEKSYNSSYQVQGIVLEFIGNCNLEPVALWNVKIKRKGKLLTKDRTLFARITGPGKVPEARVVLEHGEH